MSARELFRFGCIPAKKKAIPLESPFLTPAAKRGGLPGPLSWSLRRLLCLGLYAFV
jgi:hypothetical protein